MATASEIEPVVPGIGLWRVYDPTVKAELNSTAITVGQWTYLIDPIPLAATALEDFIAQTATAGIIVTNENHTRAAPEFANRLKVPIYSHGNQPLPVGLTAVPVEGAAAGEIAIHSNIAGGVVVMGDALINFEPYGFTFLPAKYCSNFKIMRKSLAKLLDYSFERMLFAHGTPILSGARQQLKQLLETD